MGAVRDNDLGSAEISALHMVGAHDHEAGEFTVCSGAGVEGEGVHTGNGGKGLVHFLVHLQGTLSEPRVHERMKACKALEGSHFLIDLGIVLHGAGAKRIKACIHPEVHLGQVGVVAHYVGFAYLRKFQGRITP